ncbi:MAG: glycosyltransferase family 2 protein [Bacteroidetes bacterium]|nr:glycosyltransferase family 2 protein [Bacteroidota bacterium]
MKLSIIMPVYNESATIRQIVDKVMAVQLHKELIIVDDASTDATASILDQEIAVKYPDIKILHHPANRGKAAAIRTGIPQATGEIITIQDGDLETEPEDLVHLTAPIREGRAEVVYGSRYLAPKEPHLYRTYQLGGRILSWTVNLLYDQHITDEPACYKVFRAGILKGIQLEYDRFEFCPEVTAKVSKMGYKITELPMHYYPRGFDEGKKLHWIDGLKALWVLLKYRFTD